MMSRALLAGELGLMAMFLLGGPAAAQTAPTATVKSIDVTDARPVPRALDIIEQRYDVTIDYVDAEYSNPQDLQTVTAVRGNPVKPFPIPKVRALTLYYQEMSGTPIGGITALIQSVLTQFANDGGPVFAVRELTMPYGPRWEVYPKEARDLSGALVAQPDVLDAVIQIPTGKRTSSEMVDEIGRQLSATWGRKFNIAQFRDAPIRGDNVERGAENVSALTALLRLTGQYNALRAFYMPDNNQYYVSIGPRPYHQPSRPLPPVSRAAPVARTRPAPVAVWLRRSLYYKGKMDIQSALSQAGFLHTAPTGEWDAPTTDAISRFQSANHLEVTGRINAATVRKLEPFLPQLEAHPTPHGWANGMYPALAQWLQSNPQGWTDIQTALATEGFYSGSTTGMLDLKTHNALKAFQVSNGLRQTGVFDRPTAEKLAPFIPKPGEEPPVATR